MSTRAVPNLCPYCGDEDLRPHLSEGDDVSAPGTWECRACLRAFRISMLGMIPSGGSTPAPPEVTR